MAVPLPDVNAVVRCACQHTYGADVDVISRFFVHYSGTAPTNAQLNTFAASIATNWGTSLKALASTTVILNNVQCVDLSTTSSAVGSAATSTAGTRTGQAMPSSAAAVVSYEIARRYRGGHPRGYWPFGTTTDISATLRNWTTAFVTANQTGIAAFMTAVLAAGWTGAGTLTQVNVSYYHGFTVVVNPTTGRARNVPSLRGTPVQDTVTSLIARSQIGSQRRRAES